MVWYTCKKQKQRHIYTARYITMEVFVSPSHLSVVIAAIRMIANALAAHTFEIFLQCTSFPIVFAIPSSGMFRYVPICSGMFRYVPVCSSMFHYAAG